MSSKRVSLPRLLLIDCAIFLLAACSPQTHLTPLTPTAQLTKTVPVSTQPTPPTPPAPTVLYRADWSHGFAGWRGSSGWSIVQGQLLANTPLETTITVPYQPAVPNYAIEVDVQLVKVLKTQDNQFYIAASKQPQKDGYKAGYNSLSAPPASENPDPSHFYAGFSSIYVYSPDPNVNSIGNWDFVPGFISRTYRVVVIGNKVSLYIDDTLVGNATTTDPALSSGPLSLEVAGLAMRFSNFRIMTV